MIMQKVTYFGNSWIGMFLKTNDLITLLPIDAMEKLEIHIKNKLQTKTIRLTLGDSNLIGVYVAMNSNGIILPNVIQERELNQIHKLGLNVYVSKDKRNANGNNLALNDKAGIVNPNISSLELSAMSETLGVELIPMSLAGYTTVGSACLVTNTGFLVHYRTNEDELKELRQILKVDGAKGTLNTGSGFVSYGAVVNRNGYVTGENTTPFELGRLEQALNLIR